MKGHTLMEFYARQGTTVGQFCNDIADTAAKKTKDNVVLYEYLNLYLLPTLRPFVRLSDKPLIDDIWENANATWRKVLERLFTKSDWDTVKARIDFHVRNLEFWEEQGWNFNCLDEF